VKTKKAPSNSSSAQGEFAITRSSLLTKAMRRVGSEVSSIIGCRIPMLVVLLFAISIPAFSQESDSSASFTPQENLWSQQTLTGDWGGARTRVAEKYGITVNGFWDNQYFGSPNTGNTKVKPGVDNWSRIRGTLDIDMEKLAHIRGFSLHITATLNEGADIGSKMGSLVPATGLNTINHQLRLDSWWAKEALFDGKLSLYAGQISGTDFFGYPDDYFLWRPSPRPQILSGCEFHFVSPVDVRRPEFGPLGCGERDVHQALSIRRDDGLSCVLRHDVPRFL
jgi:carbohydrate-selective porin OprB